MAIGEIFGKIGPTNTRFGLYYVKFHQGEMVSTSERVLINRPLSLDSRKLTHKKRHQKEIQQNVKFLLSLIESLSKLTVILLIPPPPVNLL